MGGGHIVVIPAMWRDDVTGEARESGTLDERQWSDLFAGHNQLGKVLAGDFGLKQQFHPHADSHVGAQGDIERLLAETDPQFLNLCLDTGHAEYCGASSVELIRKYPERIGYLHLKQINPDILAAVRAENMSWAAANLAGVMTRAAQRAAGPERRHRGRRGAAETDVRHRGTGHVPGGLRRAHAGCPAHPSIPALLRLPDCRPIIHHHRRKQKPCLKRYE